MSSDTPVDAVHPGNAEERTSMDILKRLFEQHFHTPVLYLLPLQGQFGGSGRKIIRLATETLSAIGILYDVREENIAFLTFSRHFRQLGLPVPEIYAEDLSHGSPAQEKPRALDLALDLR